MSRKIEDNEELREAVLAWLRANGLDPNCIPMTAWVSVADGQITTVRWIRGEKGGFLRAPDDVHELARESVSVPLVAEPSPLVAEWLRPRCPNCGR